MEHESFPCVTHTQEENALPFVAFTSQEEKYWTKK